MKFIAPPQPALRASAFGIAAAFGLMLAASGAQAQAPTRQKLASARGASTATAEVAPIPAAPREFRGVWVATVANIDWPSKPGLSTEQQKTELLALLDRCREINLNAVVFQVRPACDAMYDSKLEPWSEYLTGEQGKAPEPYYDPLTFAVEEAHKRGLELHCWFNPYRSRKNYNKPNRVTSPLHVSKSKPELDREYNNEGWMDPGEKGTQDHSMAVMMDVVRRYDIDGVHMDDYFYPYPAKNKMTGLDIPFPDDASYKKYTDAGGKLERDDWRRQSVNEFVVRLYRGVKAEKPWVKVGISPFGIWKPGFPEGIEGFSQHDKLYADAKLWLNNGWVDYWTPQLYWEISRMPQSYPALLRWWHEQNTKGRHLWAGNYTGKYAKRAYVIDPEKKVPEGTTVTEFSRLTTSTLGTDEVINQILVGRFQDGSSGNVHFSMKAFSTNAGGINDRLKSTVYKEPALIPASPWLSNARPAAPTVQFERAGEGVTTSVLNFSTKQPQEVAQWAVYTNEGGKWKFNVLPGSATSLPIAAPAPGGAPITVSLSAVNRYGNESRRAVTIISAPAPAAAKSGAAPTSGTATAESAKKEVYGQVQ